MRDGRSVKNFAAGWIKLHFDSVNAFLPFICARGSWNGNLENSAVPVCQRDDARRTFARLVKYTITFSVGSSASAKVFLQFWIRFRLRIEHQTITAGSTMFLSADFSPSCRVTADYLSGALNYADDSQFRAADSVSVPQDAERLIVIPGEFDVESYCGHVQPSTVWI